MSMSMNLSEQEPDFGHDMGEREVAAETDW
jgi:hypothetical protein